MLLGKTKPIKKPEKKSAKKPILVTTKLLKKWPLPLPDEGGDKEERGSVLVIGGSRGLSGAPALAGVSVLRAGAGKLQIATSASSVEMVSARIWEAMVVDMSKQREVLKLAIGAAALVIGPGIVVTPSVKTLINAVMPKTQNAVVVFDAEAMVAMKAKLRKFSDYAKSIIVTPHAGEMAALTGKTKSEILKNPLEIAKAFAREHKVITVLKGSETFIASPNGDVYLNEKGNIGLGTSGSGDTLAGIIGGLCGRGADPIQAAVWGVSLHAQSGDVLAARFGPLGFLASELPGEVPSLMARLT